MAIRIAADGTEVKIELTNGRSTFSLEELQAAVGGYIELLSLPDGRDMYLNEDGKAKGLPYNAKATALGRAAGISDRDWVVGPVIVLDPSEVRQDGDES